MAVITISRQFASGGDEVAGLLCNRLGYRYFDKDLMARLGAGAGWEPEEIVDLSADLILKAMDSLPVPA